MSKSVKLIYLTLQVTNSLFLGANEGDLGDINGSISIILRHLMLL